MIRFIIMLFITFSIPSSFAKKKGGGEHEKNVYILIPATSFGGIKIGAPVSHLTSNGYKKDKSRKVEGGAYYIGHPLLVLTKKGKVEQVWYEAKDLSKVQVNELPLPKSLNLKTAQEILHKCEKPVQGSGGTLLYCENKGLELSFDRKGNFLGISVVTPKQVTETVGTPKK